MPSVSWNASIALRPCFAGWDAVLLQRYGDGALLVRDERRSIYVALVSQEHEDPRLLVPAWDSHDFAVRVNQVLYDAGPLEIGVGDELQLAHGGAWSDEDELCFRVENVNTLEESSATSAKDSSFNAATEKTAPQPPGVSGSENAWSVFVRHRLDKVGEVLSCLSPTVSTTILSPSPACAGASTAHAT
ncbi:hypothetical protein TraAM80_01102 [Trypanosoma rangeli]|uniref:Uncharacterized protein n=1 Tax=Trypanosoma rangeli TaxID=5698 RepID=A0A3R7RR92_TRYRA|nr:uncharacterized protein TraAM80_01102 [Trypanosoma rangeli]RNF11171.1 hypothetical protein TraAM80_01102 [Trypanosoma rangeli]|eukprot:RNF11171.1 hypothetical protein TraAM80_01102 [Trypanosoma rangeli]